MRRSRITAATSTAALLLAGAIAGTTWGTSANATPSKTVTTSYVVLADQPGGAAALASRLTAAGAKVTAVNTDIGLVSVTSRDATFRGKADKLPGVFGVARDKVIGHAPDAKPVSAVERENATGARPAVAKKPATPPGTGPADPMDDQLWGMRMINADKAHAITLGSKKVRVGVIDTGVDGSHPDLAPNFDSELSRNFTTDMPEIDGPCEFDGCKDPANWDDGGHGTHVAGTIAAVMNGFGLSGVAPNVDLVNLRAGQDSGYFFLQPTVDALTFAADNGIDVVNMSFYVDPWLYNCQGGAPEDTPEQAAEQDTIIEAMTRALAYAHDRKVSLVAALGNNHEDLSNPRHDFSSPDFGAPPHERTIDNATCFDLPTEGADVIGTSALGPSGRKSDFSNYTTDLTSGEIEVSAPGGWFRDGLGTPSYRTNGNLILSTYPRNVGVDEGTIDEAGNITPDGVALGVQKYCQGETCGYYQFLQGTSMASPHAAGVVALEISAHGRNLGNTGFGMTPGAVRSLLMRTATDHACPDGGVQSYTDVGRSPEFTATCVGDPAFNGFYGAGIVNALGVVQ